jgi:hypothetical protein
MSENDERLALSDRELLVRIDTKLDGVIEDKKDHEARLRVVEDKLQHTVTLRTLWTGLAGAAGAATAVGQFIQWVVHK